MTSSDNVIPVVLPALAAALAQLRPAPGRNDGWLPDAFSALERTDTPRYERTRRRIGFAQRLGDLAGLGVEETAALRLGLFFHQLVDGQPAKTGPSKRSAWLEYLLRNDDWLAPAFEVCTVVSEDGWESLESKAAAVAKLTSVFDSETLERHNRPLQVLQNMKGEAESPLIEELIPLLWSEEGQELCDHHFRRHPDGYKVAASDLQSSFDLLRRLAPTSLADEEAAAVTPMGLFGKALTNGSREPVAEALEQAQTPRPRPLTDRQDTAPSTGANFDRRREALRARSTSAAQESVVSRIAEQSAQRQDVGEQAVAGEPIAETPAPELPPQEEPRPAERDEPEPARDFLVPVRRAEDESMDLAHVTSAVRPAPSDLLDMMQKLRDVRLQLGEIQRMATEAEELLIGLAPQLDGLTSWIAELDSVVDRWRGRTDIERAA